MPTDKMIQQYCESLADFQTKAPNTKGNITVMVGYMTEKQAVELIREYTCMHARVHRCVHMHNTTHPPTYLQHTHTYMHTHILMHTHHPPTHTHLTHTLHTHNTHACIYCVSFSFLPSAVVRASNLPRVTVGKSCDAYFKISLLLPGENFSTAGRQKSWDHKPSLNPVLDELFSL